MTDLSGRLSRALAGRYRLDREIGAGGMAIVYLAEDLKHRRQVALKVLRPDLAAVCCEPDRFLREIEIAARLAHPHILPLYDSGQADGLLYYVMPYVAGESLRDRLRREKQLPLEEALRITGEVADALAFAHAHGVVHRDIKPENILFQAGHAVVSDFGIARAVTESGGEALTATGMAVGTPAYMSPEQAAGERDVDARSDIYALGCVLYEMLVGEPPFTGPTAQVVMAKRFSDPVPSARRLRSAVTEAVDTAVRRALAQVPADRFATAAEFVTALTAPIEAAPADEKSIVVLPFENLSPDPDQAFFADGLTEEVISDLSAVRALRVISRSSAMTFKGSAKKVSEIAGELNVRYVLEGSVRRAGDNLRITAQLIDAANDTHLWAGKFPGTVEDVFDIQEKVSAAIVEALRLKLTPEEQGRMAERPIADARAHEWYLRARQQLWNLNESSLRQAIRDLEEALKLAGDNALLYAGMGSFYWQLYHNGIDATEATLARVRECAARALELEPASAHGLRVLAYLKLHDGDTVGAVDCLERCLQADPEDTEALLWAGYINAVHLGRPARGRPQAERLVAIDPLSAMNEGILALADWLAGRLDAALKGMDRWVDREPDSRLARWYCAQLLAWNGRTAEAIAQLSGLWAENDGDPYGQTAHLFGCALNGGLEDAERAIPATAMEVFWEDFHLPWLVAECYAIAGRTEEALKWLEHAVHDKGLRNYPLLSRMDPFLANIRGEPRFEMLMAGVKKEWEELVA